ncbi:hypothetical protein BV22DRAFT_793005 [Leucogyrophana mollusca]|uniref:Uncharacterized protein n=1 Tax=Leucogyrophana mollusca TaxID=85980 RepID=A0ACB8B5C4_9AGAM|nr:hypothetical protein BV22DRAFT_793005 [Leucogyrophana mollusca]
MVARRGCNCQPHLPPSRPPSPCQPRSIHVSASTTLLSPRRVSVTSPQAPRLSIGTLSYGLAPPLSYGSALAPRSPPPTLQRHLSPNHTVRLWHLSPGPELQLWHLSQALHVSCSTSPGPTRQRHLSPTRQPWHLSHLPLRFSVISPRTLRAALSPL